MQALMSWNGLALAHHVVGCIAKLTLMCSPCTLLPNIIMGQGA